MKDTDPNHPDLIRAKALVKSALDHMTEVQKRLSLTPTGSPSQKPAYQEGGLEIREKLQQMELELDKLQPGDELENPEESA